MRFGGIGSRGWQGAGLALLTLTAATGAGSQPESAPASQPDLAQAATQPESAPASQPDLAQAATQPESAPASQPAAAPALAGTAAPASQPAAEEEADARRWPVGAALSLDTSVGTGTFVADRYARNAYVGSTLSLGPYLRLGLAGHELKLAARWDLSWEYTQPDNPAGRRIEPYDARISLTDPELVELYGVTLDAAIGVVLPTSYDSLAASMILATDAGVGLGYEVVGIELGYSFLARKYFNYKLVKNVPEYYRPLVRGNLEALGNANRSARLVNQLSVGYGFPFVKDLPGLDGLALGVDFWIINDFNYDIVPDDDPYSSPYAKTGVGREDWLWTTVEVGYSPLDELWLSLGLTALHPAIDASTEHLIFPLFGAMDSLAADNWASWYVALAYTL